MTVSASQAAPGVSFAFSDMLPGEVEQIDIVIPNGHANLTGIRIYYANQQVVPWTGTQYLSGNNRTHSFPVNDFPTGAGWGGQAFNTDVHAHTFKILFYINELDAGGGGDTPAIILLPLAGILEP